MVLRGKHVVLKVRENRRFGIERDGILDNLRGAVGATALKPLD
jgi:hypothetical protein